MSDHPICGPKGHEFFRGTCVDCGELQRQPALKHPRTTRKFLIQFEGDERTRWLASDEDIRRTLEMLAKTTATSISGGTIPATYVTIEP